MEGRSFDFPASQNSPTAIFKQSCRARITINLTSYRGSLQLYHLVVPVRGLILPCLNSDDLTSNSSSPLSQWGFDCPPPIDLSPSAII